jgi:hypothetical protein
MMREYSADWTSDWVWWDLAIAAGVEIVAVVVMAREMRTWIEK